MAGWQHLPLGCTQIGSAVSWLSLSWSHLCLRETQHQSRRAAGPSQPVPRRGRAQGRAALPACRQAPRLDATLPSTGSHLSRFRLLFWSARAPPLSLSGNCSSWETKGGRGAGGAGVPVPLPAVVLSCFCGWPFPLGIRAGPKSSLKMNRTGPPGGSGR